MTTVPSADEEAVVSTVLEDPSFESEYRRFSPKRKWVIVGIVAYLSFLGPFSATAVLPAVPNIAADLHTTDTNINYSNAVFFCAMAISPCIFAPLSQVWQTFFTLIEALRSSVRIHYH
jgi:MFS family permease